MSIDAQDMAAIRKQGDLKEFLKQVQADAHAENRRRRTLVLRYPDLAAQLIERPHRHTTPEDWTGYIPPATTCTGAINTTPCRAALLTLVAEAKARAAMDGRAAA